MYALAFLGIAIGAGAFQFIQAFTLGVAGERLTKRLRFRAFKSMIKQDIVWFDDRKNAPGALTARLAVDATEVKGVSCCSLPWSSRHRGASCCQFLLPSFPSSRPLGSAWAPSCRWCLVFWLPSL